MSHRLQQLPELQVGVLSRPQSRLADFYREIGDIVSVTLSPHNRWGGFKSLRETWRAHLASTLLRPVLFVDEAQQMLGSVLSELRLLSSVEFDSKNMRARVEGVDPVRRRFSSFQSFNQKCSRALPSLNPPVASCSSAAGNLLWATQSGGEQ